MPEHDNTAEAQSPDYLSEIIKAISSASPPRDAPTSAAGATNATKSEPQSAAIGGDLLSSLLSSPELMTKLPSIIAAVKPFMEMMSAQGSSAPEAAPTFAPSSPKLQGSPHRGDGDSRTALLCAMKPYLSAERRQAIDYIVKLGRLGDILKTL